MPFIPSSYTKQTAQEALHWLKDQKEDWAKQIQNVDVAVQLYLNFKNRKRLEKKRFPEELKKLCVNDSATLQKPDETPNQGLSLCTERDSVPSSTPTPPSSSPTVFLDEKTRELLAKTTARLNLSHEKEALNILVQFGFASLKSLLKDV
ncbi:MAG: hypothetical protein OXB86_02330 [Bdellovibrionales bacterium]|nr:hypothetical protein [Bdellovibrionales bacterium]